MQAIRKNQDWQNYRYPYRFRRLDVDERVRTRVGT